MIQIMIQIMMDRIGIKKSLFEFKNSLGIYHFSNDLSDTEFKLISLVTRAQEMKEDINLTTLSNELNITRSAVTQIANKLEKKEYVEKYTTSTNKKEVYLRIGKQAIEKYEHILSKVSEFFARLINEIGQEGIENLERYLTIGRRIGQEMKGEMK